MNFRKDKEDANAPSIISLLRGCGFEVTKCERPVDIHISNPVTGRGGWAEIKAEKSMVKRGQLEFLTSLRQPGTIVANEREALAFATTFSGWTEHEKQNVIALLIRNPGMKQFTQKQVRDALNT